MAASAPDFGSLSPSLPHTLPTMALSGKQPLYGTAILLPALAFPAWILTIPPLVFHYGQRNVPVASLICWMLLTNFFNSINPLIWPRDNVDGWFDGRGLCDVEVRVFIGGSVGLGASIAMTFRRLAIVMDTSNIIIAPSRSQRIREKVVEALWCWGFPLIIILLYYIVQPLRFYVFGISGCVSAYNLSWVSIVLSAMWSPLAICVAAYYACLLVIRLLRYRSEFHSILAARNTTKSGFMRLFILSMFCVLVWLPYSCWILFLFASTLSEDFKWSEVHGPDWHMIVKVPAEGVVRPDKWGQVAFGYFIFLTLGMGADALNSYKKILCAFGLGHIFPSLYHITESGTSTPSNSTLGRKWRSTLSSKASNLFSKGDSFVSSTTNGSVCGDTITLTPRLSHQMHPEFSRDQAHAQPNKSLLARLWPSRNQKHILPTTAGASSDEMAEVSKSITDDAGSPTVCSHAWVSSSPSITHARSKVGEHGVHVVKEISQEHYDKARSKSLDELV